jgi:hypothetical protein
MAYSDYFSIQWDRFVSEFLNSIKRYAPEMISVDRLNDWYKTNSYRWNSIAENEGILLEQENNAALKNEILQEIEKFSFSEVKISKKPNALLFIGIGAVMAAGIGVLTKLYFHWRVLYVVLEVIGLVLASVIIYAKALDNSEKKRRKQIEEGYGKQLVDYKNHLIKICKKFE